MTDWKEVSPEDADRIRSGGTWVYQGGALTQVSGYAVRDELRRLLPDCLKLLSERLGLEGPPDFGQMGLEFADDLSSFTVSLQGNGQTASHTCQLGPMTIN